MSVKRAKMTAQAPHRPLSGQRFDTVTLPSDWWSQDCEQICPLIQISIRPLGNLDKEWSANFYRGTSKHLPVNPRSEERSQFAIDVHRICEFSFSNHHPYGLWRMQCLVAWHNCPRHIRGPFCQQKGSQAEVAEWFILLLLANLLRAAKIWKINITYDSDSVLKVISRTHRRSATWEHPNEQSLLNVRRAPTPENPSLP